jgi:hypothetical protein
MYLDVFSHNHLIGVQGFILLTIVKALSCNVRGLWGRLSAFAALVILILVVIN